MLKCDIGILGCMDANRTYPPSTAQREYLTSTFTDRRGTAEWRFVTRSSPLILACATLVGWQVMAGLRGKSVGAVGGGGVIEGRKLETDLNQHLHIPRSPPKTSDLNREQLAAPVTMTTSVSIRL